MKVKRFTTALVLASGMALALAWLLAGAPVPNALAAPRSPTASVIYVDADATGANNGSSWANAYVNLQSGLDAASSEDEIWVAEGVYTPTAGITRTATFQLKDDVALYGGFAGVESERNARDPHAHLTVLSGDLDGNDGTDAHGVVTDTASITGTNAYNVVTSSGLTTTAVLDGFTITAGKADGSFYPHNNGGGMVNDDSSPTLTNITFSGNSAALGGGMANAFNSNPVLVNVTFTGNFAWAGGGMRNLNSSPQMVNVTFSGNSADYAGGGMDNWASSPQLVNVTFSGNSANYGGGAYNRENSNPILTSVTFTGNTATSFGGGMCNRDSSGPLLVNVTFSGNTATYHGGGGMYNHDSSPTLINVTFNVNTADIYGGGVVNWSSSSPQLINVTFSGNTAEYGGGMHNSSSSPQLINVTFSGNSADYGGGMYNRDSSPTLTNCILWGNSALNNGDQIYNASSTPAISYSLVQDSGGSGAGWNAGLGIDGGGNVDADPQFYGDLRLQPTSPAIDAGDNTALPADVTDLDNDGNTSESIPLDLDGQPRLFDSPTTDTGSGTPPIVDMGAYEQPTYLYVDTDATGTGTGLSWTDAFTCVQDALTIASPGNEIWVAEGVYTPTTGITRTATFQLKNGVALYGGFVGVESGRNARDPHVHVTVLSGDLDGNDITDAHSVVTDTANIVGDNAYHVVTSSGVTETTVLDGFVITGGKADGSAPHISGGGMINDGGSPTLANIIFSGNVAGYGGGMCNLNSSPQLANVTFNNNVASFGGGMDNSGSSPQLVNTTFNGNYAELAGGGMSNRNSSNPMLANVTFSGNTTDHRGGGMLNDNGSSPQLINVTFSGNYTGDEGGGMYNFGSNPILINCILWGNSASNNGDQILNESSVITISYSLVQDSGGSGAGWDITLGTDGGGNIDADPQFTRDPDPGDGDWTTLADNDYGDLSLLPVSPAIDAGDNTALPADTADLDRDGDITEPIPFDMVGKPRIIGSTVDMGAYEWCLQSFLPSVQKN